MIRTAAVSLSLLIAAFAFADTPRIIDVDPIFVPPQGGLVIVTYAGVTQWCPGIDLCQPQAFLDGQEVPIVARLASGVSVLLPAHAVGTSATFTLRGSTFVAATTTLHYGLGVEYERVLLPLAPQQLAGANGSSWLVTATLMNASNDVINFLGPFEEPPGIVPSPHRPNIAPGQVVPLTVLRRHDGGDGLFVAVPSFAADDVTFASRVADVSRTAQTLGTEVPVARERDYKNKVVLLDVPNDPRYRSTLRVYGFADDVQSVRIRIFDFAGSEAFVDEVRTMIGVVHHAVPPSAFPPDYPAYLQLPLDTWPLAGHGNLRIEVTSTISVKLWGFVSVTNNDTQQVTLITPQ